MAKAKILPKMPQEVEEIIFGGLLGDFNLQSQTNGNTWRLRLMASHKHIEYINHLQEVFKPWIGSPKKAAIYEYHKVRKANYVKWYINTLVVNDLKKFGDFYYILVPREGIKYPVHKKIIPSKEILMEKLTPRAIAYWLMDDGYFSYGTVTFCTNGFTVDEVNLLREVLLEKYNIHTTLRIQQEKEPLIYVRTSSFFTLKMLVYDYVIPWFKYKLGERN